MRHTRRWVVGGVLVAAALLTFGVGIDRGAAQGPITISVIDVAGDLSSVRDIIENYKKANPQKVKDVTYQRAPAPELPARSRPSRTPAAWTSTSS